MSEEAADAKHLRDAEALQIGAVFDDNAVSQLDS
jgi:hypothetical protein